MTVAIRMGRDLKFEGGGGEDLASAEVYLRERERKTLIAVDKTAGR